MTLIWHHLVSSGIPTQVLSLFGSLAPRLDIRWILLAETIEPECGISINHWTLRTDAEEDCGVDRTEATVEPGCGRRRRGSQPAIRHVIMYAIMLWLIIIPHVPLPSPPGEPSTSFTDASCDCASHTTRMDATLEASRLLHHNHTVGHLAVRAPRLIAV